MSLTFTILTGAKTVAGSIKRFTNYAEIDSEVVLDEAQAFLVQTLRVREMRSEFTDLSLIAGDSSEALPAGFLDPIYLYDKTNNIRLKMRDEAALLRRRVYESAVLVSGIPTEFAIFSEALQFECKYESAATLNLVGYKIPTRLGTTPNESNFLTDRYPHLLRVACEAMAHSFMNNVERENAALAKLAALIGKTNAESDLAYRGLVPDVEIP